jgi:prevent-host-death family protein
MKVAVREAKNQLSKLGDKAHAGETIIVTKHGKPWFDLVPHNNKHRCITAIPGVKPSISIEQATAPLSEEDLPGWM